jgi:hypothetical protein
VLWLPADIHQIEALAEREPGGGAGDERGGRVLHCTPKINTEMRKIVHATEWTYATCRLKVGLLFGWQVGGAVVERIQTNLRLNFFFLSEAREFVRPCSWRRPDGSRRPLRRSFWGKPCGALPVPATTVPYTSLLDHLFCSVKIAPLGQPTSQESRPP